MVKTLPTTTQGRHRNKTAFLLYFCAFNLSDMLDRIIAHKHQEVAQRREMTPITALEQQPYFSRQGFSLGAYITNPTKTGIIAEYKRKSPSKGIINDTASVADVTTGYAQAGASALSILTDSEFFGGTTDDVLAARPLHEIPILRKEFIIDEYQIIEAKAMGADAILLIAACLDKKTIQTFSEVAFGLGLSVLLELHGEEEIEHITDTRQIIGINNRNLKTMQVDIDTSFRMIEALPAASIKVAESGIQQPETIRALRKLGYQGFLIGENFMKTNNPAQAFHDFVARLNAL